MTGAAWRQPHHDGSPLYTGAGLLELGAQVPLRVHVPHHPDGRPAAERVVLRWVRDGEPAIRAATLDSSDETGSWWSVPVDLDNPVTSYRFLLDDAREGYRWLTGSGVHHRDVTDAGDFKISTEHRLPDWVADQVGYQVFPDRFERTRTGVEPPGWAQPAGWDDPVVHRGPDVPHQLYGGTLDGIAARLEHLELLGATLLYLTPVFEARSNHRYDAVSFDRVDPLLGGDEALSRLLAAAHGRGIRVIGDLTTNHTGEHHDWFQRALAEPDSVERGFYKLDEDGSYECWFDVPSLPKLDHTSPELARRLYDGPGSVAARWLRDGLDGWRIDVANMTGRTGADDLAHQVARRLRRTIDTTSPDAWLLAEHGHDASGDLTGGGWHGTMDYAGFTRPVWCWLNGGSAAGPGTPHGLTYLGLPVDIPVLPGQAVVATMREVHGAMPWVARTASTLHLDTHDTPRFRTVAGGGTDGWIDTAGTGRERHLVGLALQMTVPGVPVVFMGDELGLTGLDGEHARTPFPWRRRQEWDSATLAAYTSWIGLRRAHVALRRGGMRWVHVGEHSVTFLREHPEETVLVHAVRARTEAVTLPLAALGAGSRSVVALEGTAPQVTGSALTLTGDGPAVAVALVER